MSRPATISTADAQAGYKYLGADTVVSEDYTSVGVKLDVSVWRNAAWAGW